MNQVVAPYHPGVQAGCFDLCDGHVFGFEEVDQSAVGFDKSILGAAGDP